MLHETTIFTHCVTSSKTTVPERRAVNGMSPHPGLPPRKFAGHNTHRGEVKQSPAVKKHFEKREDEISRII